MCRYSLASRECDREVNEKLDQEDFIVSNTAILEVQEQERELPPHFEPLVAYKDGEGPTDRRTGLVQSIVDRELANGRMPA